MLLEVLLTVLLLIGFQVLFWSDARARAARCLFFGQGWTYSSDHEHQWNVAQGYGAADRTVPEGLMADPDGPVRQAAARAAVAGARRWGSSDDAFAVLQGGSSSSSIVTTPRPDQVQQVVGTLTNMFAM